MICRGSQVSMDMTAKNNEVNDSRGPGQPLEIDMYVISLPNRKSASRQGGCYLAPAYCEGNEWQPDCLPDTQACHPGDGHRQHLIQVPNRPEHK
jgi:hypothetical protein